jgi:hypothetical protein
VWGRGGARRRCGAKGTRSCMTSGACLRPGVTVGGGPVGGDRRRAPARFGGSAVHVGGGVSCGGGQHGCGGSS